MRHLFVQAIGLRLRDREEVAVVLGEGAIAHGASATRSPPAHPASGTCWAKTTGRCGSGREGER